MTKIKPCPRCGKPAHVAELISGYGTMYSVACNDIDCMFFELTRAYRTADEAVREWNTRVGERIVPVANITIDEEKMREIVSEAMSEVTVYDRDSLLKLADECDKAFKINTNSAYDVIAKRIREACGVVEDAD